MHLKVLPSTKFLSYTKVVEILIFSLIIDTVFLLVLCPSILICPIHNVDFLGRSPDTIFYSEPRFVTHIDDPAIRALTKYYSEAFPPSDTPGVCLLDLCSSWVNYFLFSMFLVLSL